MPYYSLLLLRLIFFPYGTFIHFICTCFQCILFWFVHERFCFCAYGTSFGLEWIVFNQYTWF